MIKDKIIYNNASNWKFDLAKAQGCFLWDSQGNKLLDFTSGWNTTNLGWNNIEINNAMKNQISKGVSVPMELSVEIQRELAKQLTASLPRELDAIGRTTGGVESNEEAIKTAMAYTGRKKILGFKHGYHGQSLTMLSLVLDSYEIESIRPKLSGFIQMDFPATFNFDDSELLEKFTHQLDEILSKEDVAAVLTESGIITGWGSTYVAPRNFISTIRKLTKKYGSLMIVDEVGTGFSRCGKLFGIDIEHIIPDIVTLAKGFSNGAAPIGAMITTTKIAQKTWQLSNLQSTFGWLPISCAAARKNLEIHKRDKIWEKSAKDGNYIRDVLKKELKDVGIVGDVRGLGMEIGVQFVTESNNPKPNEALAMKVESLARSRGLYLLYGDDGNIQLMPPLIMDRALIVRGLEVLLETIKSFSKQK